MFTNTRIRLFVFVASVALCMLASAAMGGISGAIWTTDAEGSTNQNHYDAKSDVYLNGGPDKDGGSLPDGIYYFQITNPAGSLLLSSDAACCRQLQVSGGKVVGAYADPACPGCTHENGYDSYGNFIGVHLMPFNDNPKNKEYKVDIILKSTAVIDPQTGIISGESKSDNFQVFCDAVQITCPPNISIQCGQSIAPPFNFSGAPAIVEPGPGTATFEDGCGDVTLSYIDTAAGGDCVVGRTINRTWRATDEDLNVAECVQIITVAPDTEAPVVTPPADVTVECDESTEPDATGWATAVDNCDGAIPRERIRYADSVTEMNCKHAYTIERSWTAVDLCENVSLPKVQKIKVVDTTAPVVTPPADAVVECDESSGPEKTGYATAKDNCDDSPSICHSDGQPTPGECPQSYSFVRTWTAKDACGNEGSAAQTITVQDTKAPAISCPSDIFRLSWPAPTCERKVDIKLTAKDNCDPNPVVIFTRSDGKDIMDPFPGDDSEQGLATTVTAVAKDACGNESEPCEFVVRVKCIPTHVISGTKWYDDDGSGEYEGTETPVAGFRIKVCYTLPDETSECQTVETDTDGIWMLELPEGTSFTACEVKPVNNWWQTGPLPGAEVMADGKVAATANGNMCWVGEVGKEPVMDLDFFNVCYVLPHGGYTKGFWQNKNGQEVLSAHDPAWRLALNALCLRNEDGSHFDVPLYKNGDPAKPIAFRDAYQAFREWIRSARAVNMAYMLSAQLAADTLDQLYMGLVPDAKLLLPRSLQDCIEAGSGIPGLFSIAQICYLADAELCANGLTVADSPSRSYQGCLEKVIDGINNNYWYWLAPEKCTPDYPSAP